MRSACPSRVRGAIGEVEVEIKRESELCRLSDRFAIKVLAVPHLPANHEGCVLLIRLDFV